MLLNTHKCILTLTRTHTSSYIHVCEYTQSHMRIVVYAYMYDLLKDFPAGDEIKANIQHFDRQQGLPTRFELLIGGYMTGVADKLVELLDLCVYQMLVLQLTSVCETYLLPNLPTSRGLYTGPLLKKSKRCERTTPCRRFNTWSHKCTPYITSSASLACRVGA